MSSLKIWLCKDSMLRFGRALLASPDGTASMDDTHPNRVEPWPDDGPWRGDIPKAFRRAGFVVRDADTENSVAKPRKASLNRRWRVVDRRGLERFLETLEAWLAENPMPEESPDKQPTRLTRQRQFEFATSATSPGA